MPRDPIKTLEALEKKLEGRVSKVLDSMAFKIRRRVVSQEFLKWKTRRRPIVVEKSKVVGTVLTATVRGASKWTWGHVHIGPPGSTVLKARSGMLAIPTDAANKTFKSKRVGPKQYGGTVIFGGIIWGKAGWAGTGGYVRQRRAAGEKLGKESLVPLFILKGSVVVKRRIIPSQLIQWIRPQFAAALKKHSLVVR